MHRLGTADAVRDEPASGVGVAAQSGEPGLPREELRLAPLVVAVDGDLPCVVEIPRGELPVARLRFDIREILQDSGAHGLASGVDDGAELTLEHVTRAAQVAVPQQLLAEQAAHRREPRGGAVNGAERERPVQKLALWAP